MPSTSRITDAILTTTATAGTATYRYNNSVLLPSLEQRLQMPPTPSQIRSPDIDVLPEINSSSLIPTIGQIASVLVSNFRSPPVAAITPSSSESGISTLPTSLSYHHFHHRPSHHQYQETDLTITSTTSTVSNSSHSSYYPTFNPPDIESLVASSAEEFSNNFRDLSFDVFDDNDNDLFGSPLAFDASENGLWNGRFVPPPPRPPFFVDEPVLTDGLTTCDLCSWAMPTKSTFIFEGTMEKASELGWPLTLTIVSILSALLGAIIMITIVKCRRKKTSHQRSADTHVQWWSRNKRPNGNNNHLRRSNIYTAHPADSIRGLQQNSLSAASSITAMTAAIVNAAAASPASVTQMPFYHHSQMQQLQQQQQQQQHHQHQQQHHFEHEYHQPQELHIQLQSTEQNLPPTQHHHSHHHHHQHQHQHSSSTMSSSSTTSMPSLLNNNMTQTVQQQIQQQIPMPEQLHLPSNAQPQQQQQQQQQHLQHQHPMQHQHQHSSDLQDNLFHWPNTLVTS